MIDGESGSGKTSFVEAIIWVFYGKGRLDSKSLIKHGKTAASVEIVLEDGEKTWTIRRTVNKKASQTLDLLLEVGGKAKGVEATSLKEKQEYIEKKILKSSYELFLNSVVYPQDSINNFVRQTASKRKELLLEIVGAGNFEEWQEKTKNVLAQISDEKNRLLVEQQVIGTQLTMIGTVEVVGSEEELQTRIKSKTDELSAAVAKIEGLEKLNNEFAVMLNRKINWMDDKRKIQDELARLVQVDITEVNKQIAGLEWTLKEFEPLKEEYNKLIKLKDDREKAITTRLEIQSHLPANIPELERDVAELNKELITLMSKPVESCPVISKPCPRIQESIDAQQKTLTEKLTAKGNTLDKAKMKFQECQDRMVAIVVPSFDQNKLNEMATHLSEEGKVIMALGTLKLTAQRAQGVEEQRKGCLTRLEGVERNLGLILGDLSLKFETQAKDIGELKISRDMITKELFNLTVALGNLKDTIAKADMVKKLTARTQECGVLITSLTDKERCVTLVKEALGVNGIKVVIVETILPRLEKRINEILTELSDMRIRLDSQRDGAEEGKKVDGLFITVTDGCGEDQDFDLFSGGEKLKIVVAITEALASLNNNIEFRILDEAVTALDQNSAEKFSEILLKLQEKFSQILCISHLPEVKNLFEKRILVAKNNGTSKILIP